MKILKAKELAARGFYVFPLCSDSKLPFLKGPFRSYATNSVSRIETFWKDPLLSNDSAVYQDYNIGISTDKFQKDKALVVVDIDTKHDGFETLKTLPALAETFCVKTASGGEHHYYFVEKALTQGSSVLGKGIDIRSFGGQVVAPGSTIGEKEYTIKKDIELAPLPDWIREKLSIPRRVVKSANKKFEEVDFEVSQRKIDDIFKLYFPGDTLNGDRATSSYKVAASLKDLGLSREKILDTLLDWNENKCVPPMDVSEVQRQVASVFAYGQKKPGVDAPEFEFKRVKESEAVIEDDKEIRNIDDLVEKINKTHAWIKKQNMILHETEDEFGNFLLQRISVDSFNNSVANMAKISAPVGKVWIKHPNARKYDRTTFYPGPIKSKKSYNLFRGFAIDPLSENEKPTQAMIDGVEALKLHILENVALNEQSHARWITAWFKNIVESPAKKPLTALVLQGKKGVGKDSLLEVMAYIMPQNYHMTSNPRILTSQFNSVLEQCLLVVFNEAIWSKDPIADATLKHLVTGTHHKIEHKGKEAYDVKNFTRVCVITNDASAVNATADERRYAVFSVGAGKQQNFKFFSDMKTNLFERGGIRLWRRYLRDFDDSDIDLNIAPKTSGLAQQKIESLKDHEEWWHSSLRSGALQGHVDEINWTFDVSIQEAFYALSRYIKTRNIRTRAISINSLGRFFTQMGFSKIRKQVEGAQQTFIRLGPLESCRKKWSEFLKIELVWDDDVVEDVIDDKFQQIN